MTRTIKANKALKCLRTLETSRKKLFVYFFPSKLQKQSKQVAINLIYFPMFSFPEEKKAETFFLRNVCISRIPPTSVNLLIWESSPIFPVITRKWHSNKNQLKQEQQQDWTVNGCWLLNCGLPLARVAVVSVDCCVGSLVQLPCAPQPPQAFSYLPP